MFAKNYEENKNEFEDCISQLSEINSFPPTLPDFIKYKNINGINDEEEIDKENHQYMEDYHYYLLGKSENGNNILEKEDKMTSSKSNPIKEESKKNEEPIYYSIDNILDILSDDKFHKFRNILLTNKNSNHIPNEIELSKEKKQKTRNDNKKITILIKNQKEENQLKKKRGRKGNNINNSKEHGKMGPDNIIKKIKAKLFQYIIDSINNLVNKKENILLNLDYQFIDRLNREQDLKYLKMTLKELLSKDISPKYYPKAGKDYNKNKIEYILKYEADSTIEFVFNINFADWLDIFTLKKTVRQIVEKYNCLEQNIDCQKIERSFIDIEELLNKISDKNTEEYFALFVFYLYNYERWFYIKHGRNRLPK